MKKIDVSIIIINYNTAKLTTACVLSVLKNTETNFEIIVIDNASKEKLLSFNNSKVKVINNKIPYCNIILYFLILMNKIMFIS